MRGVLTVLCLLSLLVLAACQATGTYIQLPKDQCDLNHGNILCWKHLDDIFNKQCDEPDTREFLTQRTTLKVLAFLLGSQRLDETRDTAYQLLDLRFHTQRQMSEDPSILIHGIEELRQQLLLAEHVSRVFAVTFEAYNENYPTQPLHFTTGKLDKAIVIAKHYNVTTNRREFKIWQGFKTCLAPHAWNFAPNGTELYSSFGDVLNECQLAEFLESLESVVNQHNAGHFLHHVDWDVLEYRDDQDMASERFKDQILKKTDWAIQQDIFEAQHDDAIFRDVFVHKAPNKTKVWRGLHFFVNFASMPYDEIACAALSNPQWM